MRPWIGVDFDGTLAKHGKPPYRPDVVGEPIPRMVTFVRRLLAQEAAGGPEVRIFSARAALPNDEPNAVAYRSAAVAAVEGFCLAQFGKPLPVTCEKDYGCVAIYDDIAHGVIRDTGVLAS